MTKAKSKARRQLLIHCLVFSLLVQLAIPFTGSTVYAQSTQDNEAMPLAALDQIIFGNSISESAHSFQGQSTEAIVGALGESARVSLARVPAEKEGGDLTFTMKVDPYLQNYFTLKFWGNDSGYTTMVHINGEQVGYFRFGDYQPINRGFSNPLPGRFYYATTMLPLESTYGKETVEITIKSLDPFGNMAGTSRAYYRGYTHTDAWLDVSSEQQGSKPMSANLVAAGLSEQDKQARITEYTQSQITMFNNLSTQVDAGANAKMSIEKYKDDLRFYANALHYDWSPANTAQLKKAAIERIFKVIDNHVKDYYGNTRLVTRGAHQGDWGSYYSALGEALYIIEPFIKDESIYGEDAFNEFLDLPFQTGTVEGEFSLASEGWDGEQLTRRGAWERALKASFDFARSRLSYIYNQMLYTYEGAWEAHVGLGVIHSQFYEGKTRSEQILMETLGGAPFLGEEVLVGPNGEELDLYHSLFYHDGSARFTEDYLQIVAKGLAKSKLDNEGKLVRRTPYGEHYYGISDGGLTRENGYVANYGEATNYLPEYVFKTWNSGDRELSDKILQLSLKNLHGRGYTRIQGTDENGNRVMRAEQILDERNTSYPGFAAYASRNDGVEGKGMLFASLEMHMAENEDRYSSPEWDTYWQYASEAVGFMQQQLLDNQYFNFFGTTLSKNRVDYQLADTYHYVTSERATFDRFDRVAAGAILPLTDFSYYKPEELAQLGVSEEDYTQFAYADVDNMYFAIRDGDQKIIANLNELNKGYSGIGRLHVINDDHEFITEVKTNSIFQYEDYWIRMHNIDAIFMQDQASGTQWTRQSLAGEMLPITYQPGVGTVSRDNFEADTPYAGYPDLLTARYGQYLMIVNSTRDEYGNERSYEVELPADYSGSTVLDLVSGQSIPVNDGKVTIAEKSAMVLKLTEHYELNAKPHHVDFVSALIGNGYVGLSWKTTAGAKSYQISRATSEQGPYTVIASNVTGNFYKDTTAQNGNVYYYKVTGVNEHGLGWDSWRAQADLTMPISAAAAAVWRDDRIGTSTGTATINDDSIAIAGVDGTGLGDGDDYIIYEREINDSLHYVHTVTRGNSSISAKIDSNEGALSGLMLRDTLKPNTRYIYFGADEHGKLVLQNRTRDSRHDFSDRRLSPLNAELEGYTVAEYPYISLVRDHSSQYVHAFVSADGEDWQYVTKLFTTLPFAYYSGVAASEEASFSEVTVTERELDVIYPFVEKNKDQITLHWNKPKQASWVNVYRTFDAAASNSDPQFKQGTTELEEGSAWELILADSRATSFDETRLRYGSAYYKVLAVHGDGTPQPFSATVSANADSIEKVLEDARKVPTSDYTKQSYYLYLEELNRIEAEKDEPGADKEALIDAVYDASNLLVSVRTLLSEIEVQPSMARASEKFWNNDSIDEQANAWYLFDKDPITIAHTRSVESWVDVDFGAGNEKVIDTFRFLPRRTHVDRTNGTVFRGSNDGVNWTDLYVIPKISAYEWYFAANTDPTPYRYIRIYDNHNGFVNFEEIEFYELPVDKTLLSYLVDEAGTITAEYYTSASLQQLQDEIILADEVLNDDHASQTEVDEASNELLAKLEGLQYIDGLPVLAGLQDKNIIAEHELTFTVEAVNAGDDVTYTAADLPDGAVFNPTTQQFQWTPRKDQGGIHHITFTAAAGALASSKTIKIIVKGQPVFEPNTAEDIVANELLTYVVPASDPTGEPLQYAVGELPEGASFNSATGTLTWRPAQADYGAYPITFMVSNGRYSVSATVEFNVNLQVLSSADYTRGSYYLYMQEVERIQAAIVAPGANKEQLVQELIDAEKVLVPVGRSLYSFEGNSDNAIGTSHGATYGTITYPAGKYGDAIDLNGSNGYVELPDTHALASYDELTFASWVYWRGGNQWQRMFDFGVDTNRYLFLSPRSGNNTLRFAIKNNGGEQLIDAPQLAQNTWVHVAVTLGQGTAKLYVNGVESAAKSDFTIKPSDVKPNRNYLAKSQYDDPLFNGLIDEVHIFNYALSSEELQDVMNNTFTSLDDSLLVLLLQDVAELNEDYYTEESFAAVMLAEQQAQDAVDGSNVTQAQIDHATEQLLEALEALAYVDGYPVFAPITAQSVNANQLLSFAVTTLNEVDDVSLNVVGELPEGASFDAAQGMFTWTPSKEQTGIYNITVSASAGEYTSTTTVQIKVIGQPVISFNEEVDLTARSAYVLQLPKTGTINEPLLYSVTETPNGASFNAATGEFRWTPAQGDYGVHQFNFTVSNEWYTVAHSIQFNVSIDVLPRKEYTKLSYYLYEQELTRIQAEMNEAGADMVELEAQLVQAENQLVSITTLAGDKINVEQGMVEASTAAYGNSDDAQGNGWRAFDGNLSNSVDTTSNPSWVMIDFGENAKEQAEIFKFYPRSTHISRVNGASLQGSNDGADWTTLYTINGITAAAWHAALLPESDGYRYYRYYAPTGNANVAELEFYKLAIDTTLLDHLLAEAADLNIELYTEKSLANLNAAVSTAESLLNELSYTQEEIDLATEQLLAALGGLILLTPAKATLAGNAMLEPGEHFQVTVGLTESIADYSILDVIVEADFSYIELAMEKDLSDRWILSQDAITILHDDVQLLGTAVVPQAGLLRILLSVVGDDVAAEQAALLQLNGTIAVEVEPATTTIALQSFTGAIKDRTYSFDTTEASLSLTIQAIDKSALQAVIEEAEELIANAVIGAQPGQYPQQSADSLQAAIDSAKQVVNVSHPTKQQINGAITSLQAAMTSFAEARNPEIEEPNPSPRPVEPTISLNTTELKGLIDQARSLHDSAREGNKLGTYKAGAKASLYGAIGAAETALYSYISQAHINAASKQLSEAINSFYAQLNTLIPGQSKITTRDLAMVANFYRTRSSSDRWKQIEMTNLVEDDQGEDIIDIRDLAAIAQLILEDWTEN